MSSVITLDESPAATNTSALLARLVARSEWQGDCLVWTGALHASGYGSITIGGRRGTREGVHRVAWIIRHGPIDPGMSVCHRCDNPPCWADDHLFLGTHAENMADMMSKGRKTQRVGEDAPGAKLTNAQAADVKRRLVAGETQASIGALYGVSKVAIGHIKRGRNFVNVPWPETGE